MEQKEFRPLLLRVASLEDAIVELRKLHDSACEQFDRRLGDIEKQLGLNAAVEPPRELDWRPTGSLAHLANNTGRGY